MTLRECYESFGGNYEDVISRLIKEERITKYLGIFSSNDDYTPIKNAILALNREEAFRGVHTLKGAALNLGLTPLSVASDELCEYLRNPSADPGAEEVNDMLEAVKVAYNKVIDKIKEYLGA